MAWKIVYAAVIFSLVVLGAAYYLISPRESVFFSETKTEKIAEFKETWASGRKDGKKVWELKAKSGWTAKGQEITYLNDVSDGRTYIDGKLVVKELFAPLAKIYRRTEIVEAFGSVRAEIELGRAADSRSKKRVEWTKMKADLLRYIPNEKRSEIRGNIFLTKKDSSISAQQINVNHETKVSDITDTAVLKRKDAVVSSDKMRYFSKEEKLEANNNVDVRITEKKLKTRVKCDHASFYLDLKKEMQVAGSVEVAQGKKLAVAQDGVYSQQKKELLLLGQVKAVFEKARVLLNPATVEKLKGEEARKILKEKVVLTSNELIFSTRTGDAKARGSVIVTLKGREAKSDEAVYDDKLETLVLTGNVSLKQKDKWVKAKKVIVSVKKESFEAVGSVEAEFKL